MDLNCCFCEPLTKKYCISFILWLLSCPAEILGFWFPNIYIYSEDWYEHAHCEPAYWGLNCWGSGAESEKVCLRSVVPLVHCHYWLLDCDYHLLLHPAPIHTLLPGDETPSPHSLLCPATPPLCPLNPVLQLALSALTIESLLPQGGVLWGVFSEGLQRWPWHCNSHTPAHT